MTLLRKLPEAVLRLLCVGIRPEAEKAGGQRTE